MTLPSTKKEKLIGITGFILIVLIFVGVYLLYIQPLISTLENKKRELQNEEQLLSLIQKQIIKKDSNSFEGAEMLQRKIPIQPLVEQLLLEIEKAEIVSGSQVSNMDFSTGEIEAEREELTPESYLEGSKKDNKEEISSIPMPEGMKKTTVVLSVTSSNYFEMEKFIETLESENRIIIIENLEILGQDEVVSTEQEKQAIESEITITAFYMPTLTDLIEQLPKMEVPEPSDKRNPFSMSGTILNKAAKELEKGTEDLEIVSPKNNTQNIQLENEIVSNQGLIHYIVQPGDTLYSISMKFYKTRKGEQIIKDRNRLNGNVVKTGEVLEIPLSSNY